MQLIFLMTLMLLYLKQALAGQRVLISLTKTSYHLISPSFLIQLPPIPFHFSLHILNISAEEMSTFFNQSTNCEHCQLFDSPCQQTISEKCDLCRHQHNYKHPSVIGCCAPSVNSLINANGSMGHKLTANECRLVPSVSFQAVVAVVSTQAQLYNYVFFFKL